MSVLKYDMGLRPDWPEDWPEEMVALADYEALEDLARELRDYLPIPVMTGIPEQVVDLRTRADAFLGEAEESSARD